MEAYTQDGRTLIAQNLDHEHAQQYQEMGFRICGDTFRSNEAAEAFIKEEKEMFGKDGLD